MRLHRTISNGVVVRNAVHSALSNCVSSPITGNVTPAGSYLLIYLDGTWWRKGIRNSTFVTDKTLTPLGFNGEQDTDWENLRTTTL